VRRRTSSVLMVFSVYVHVLDVMACLTAQTCQTNSTAVSGTHCTPIYSWSFNRFYTAQLLTCYYLPSISSTEQIIKSLCQCVSVSMSVTRTSWTFYSRNFPPNLTKLAIPRDVVTCCFCWNRERSCSPTPKWNQSHHCSHGKNSCMTNVRYLEYGKR